MVIPNLDSPWVGATLAALLPQVGGSHPPIPSASPPPPGEPPTEPVSAEVLIVGRDRHRLVPRGDEDPGGVLRFLVTPEPLSPAAARNLGVTRARGEKVLFTDADCFPRPGWLQHLAKALDRSPVAGGAVTFSLEAGYWAVADNIASFHELLADRPAEATTEGALGSLNLGVTRGAWERVGPFDEGLTTSEDFDWVLRARREGLATAFEPRALVEHAPVRGDRAALVAHARWYGRHFHQFRRRHPEALATGPSWASRRRLALLAPLKAWSSAVAVFRRHPQLPWRHLPGVVLFKWVWYRAVLAGWKASAG